MDNFIAHIREIDGKDQSLSDHLQEASKFAGQFAGKIGLQEVGEIIGLFHDLGKASNEFQNYIRSANGRINPDADEYVDFKDKKGKIDHSSAGAQIIYRDLCDKGAEGFITAQVLSLCIASHHSGLIDCLTPEGKDNFSHRMEKSEERTHVDEVLKNITINEEKKNQYIRIEKDLVTKFNELKEQNDSKETFTFKCGLLIRFLFSCLIDADRLSTADFESRNNIARRNYGHYQSWDTLIHRLNERLDEFEKKENKNDVDELRNKVSQSCLNFSSKPKGIYQLTVPTGGGKTLASLRFALNHAKTHGMERIFYIIPYTSIIDQNAEEVRKILEDIDENGNYSDKVVLEHHSNLTPEEETSRQSLLSQNWDAPIVFTTQVQFLEALFGSGTRGARRMHQLANSVIIFDEVQTIPIRCVHMFNIGIRFLVHNCGSTTVLCTATQPLLDKVDPIQRALSIKSDQQMISDTKALFEQLKRVEVNDRRKIGGWTDEEVVDLVKDELKNEGSVLVIVNTKKSARTLFTTLKERNIEHLYHLSTNMCPVHRLEVLDSIKKKLIEKKPVVCISTQLIEAGVDIDFGSVIRYLAGLDSITQAAGRCNRNGNRNKGNMWIVNPSIENIANLKDIKVGVQVTERILDEYLDNSGRFGNDRIGLEAMEKYYQYYFYQRKDEMSYRVGKQSILGRDDNLFNLLSVNTYSVSEYERTQKASPSIPFQQSFQTASRLFRVIDSNTRGVIVPFGEEGKELINDLCSISELKRQFKLLKKAQR
ncbi:MAG TPA: CRISPR-associated helicase/endonuclease Cas3, partial [Clostridiales bacterium]|nr:CRISPR-associated helicase/endonuclease Cas3 [Clostridiales bacterium]